LAGLGERLWGTPEEFKAWSQNMRHEGVMTTFNSYGEVSRERQAHTSDRSMTRKRRAVIFQPSKEYWKLLSQSPGTLAVR
jgi:hypothetical protein